ncbi:hypothetical protein QAD02_002732 [Eretmocerus hayati]|uniref:Uncharacterized protein n=1 Tax=Eretmocerus hayati TaxID=131215 RepID=A0ACC2NKP5_9HYME|nr:hypothetical protein QAD02_002732 [Eretmocerus hayati]
MLMRKLRCLYEIAIILRISQELSEDTILNGLDAESRKVICKVDRILPTVKSNFGPAGSKTDKIKIYAKTMLPKSVRLFRTIYRDVNFSVPAILRCYRCQRFGHGASPCEYEARYSNCGSHDSEEKDSRIEPEPERKCSRPKSRANCKEDHAANDQACLHFKFNTELDLLMTQKQLCRSEAMNLIRSNFKTPTEVAMRKPFCELRIDIMNPYIKRRD